MPETENTEKPLSDEDLAVACQQGNEKAFAELVYRYEKKVYAIAFRITLNREDALDVAQEVFTKVYRKISAWRPSGAFGAWLIRLTVNQAIDALRKRKRHTLTSFLDNADTRNHISSADTTRQTAANEVSERIQAALRALSPTQRAVFSMRHFEGYQLNDIADALHCTVGSVKVHLFRALRKMQQQLQDLR